jgi:hypothetical protein
MCSDIEGSGQAPPFAILKKSRATTTAIVSTKRHVIGNPVTHIRRMSRWRRFLRFIPICRTIPLPTGRFIMTKMTVPTEGSCFRIIETRDR